MGTLCILSVDIWFFTERNCAQPRVLPWQQPIRCHSVSFAVYISGAISGDIVDSVFYCLREVIYDIITFIICIIQKRKYLLTEKRYSKK